MSDFLQQVFTLLTTEAGSLTYHLVLAFSIAGAIPGAIQQYRIPGIRQPGRMIVGLGGLLLFQLVLFASTGLIWQGLFNSGDLLPLIDRAVILLSLVVITWLWAFPEPNRVGDAAVGLLALSVMAFLILAGTWWFDQPLATPLDGSWIEGVSDYLALVLTALGIFILLIRRVSGWGLGLAMLVGLGLGHLANLVFAFSGGDYSGAIRLTQMACYPLLLALPTRLSTDDVRGLALRTAPVSPRTPVISPDRHSVPLDIKTLRALMHVDADGSLDAISQILAKVTAHTLVADVCLLVSPPDAAGNMDMLGGYDLIRERTLPKISLGKDLTPTLGIALQRHQALRLPASSGSAEMVYLGHRLSVQKVGHLLAVPINYKDGTSMGGIVILSPYTMRTWSEDDQNRMTELAESTAIYLQQTGIYLRSNEELKQIREALLNANREMNSVLADRQALMARIQDMQAASTTEQIQAENISNLQEELRLALQEIAILNGFQSSSREASSIANLSKDDFADILALAAELRQPLSSLVGYTDVLLAESHGILGSRQRKIVERIRVSNERMDRLLDELIGSLNVEERRFGNADSQEIDLAKAIQEAALETQPLRQAKQISMRYKAPGELPSIHANSLAFHEVLVQLINNATNVSTPVSDIQLQAQIRAGAGEEDYILLQITDSGKGLSREELPFLFSKNLTPGEGIHESRKNGSGLSSVKTLVESFGGRILVDSEPGRGTTFSLLLPVHGA